MKRRGLLLLLLSGCVMVCHPQPRQPIREFHYINVQMSWYDAQQYCRDNYADLAIINSPANILEAQEEAGGEVWIGLSQNWTWSQTGQVLPSFTNWAPNEPEPKGCASISGSGVWTARSCTDSFYFICYNNVTNVYTLVTQSFMWSEAQSFCRNIQSDLSTITSMQDNIKTTGVLPMGWDAWIGLTRQYWVWSDLSKASNLPWAGGKPDDNNYCVTMDTSGFLHSHNCDDNHVFLCYKDAEQSVSRSVKVRLTAGSANLNDPKVQESILQQVRGCMKDTYINSDMTQVQRVREKLADQGITEQVTLRWKTQPDGKVFHKEEEEACPTYSDCGTG